MKFWLFILLTTNAFATLKMEEGIFLPFNRTTYPLRELIKDYAEAMQINVLYTDQVVDPKVTVHLEVNSKTSKEDFKRIFYTVLDAHGTTVYEEKGFIVISEARDLRYHALPLYEVDNLPKDASYGMVVYSTKYPLASMLSRNLRPFLSRYGRIIGLSDARTLIISDRGENFEHLLKITRAMDTEEGFQKLLSEEPKPTAENELNEKIVELKAEKKILEKKYMELREGGVMSNIGGGN